MLSPLSPLSSLPPLSPISPASNAGDCVYRGRGFSRQIGCCWACPIQHYMYAIDIAE